MLGRHEIQEVLVEVGADDVPTPTREAGTVQLLEERREPRRDDRVEHDLGAGRHDVGDDVARSRCDRAGSTPRRRSHHLSAVTTSRTFLFSVCGQM